MEKKMVKIKNGFLLTDIGSRYCNYPAITMEGGKFYLAIGKLDGRYPKSPRIAPVNQREVCIENPTTFLRNIHEVLTNIDMWKEN
jgi:hypothetical protein